jgi:hypothetical protein
MTGCWADVESVRLRWPHNGVFLLAAGMYGRYLM